MTLGGAAQVVAAPPPERTDFGPRSLYQLSGSVLLNGGCSFIADYRRANCSSPSAWSKGRQASGAVLHSSHEPGELTQRHWVTMSAPQLLSWYCYYYYYPIWDHTVLPATLHKWTHPTLTTARGRYSIYLYPEGMEDWVDIDCTWLVTYQDGLPAHRRPDTAALNRRYTSVTRYRQVLVMGWK